MCICFLNIIKISAMEKGTNLKLCLNVTSNKLIVDYICIYILIAMITLTLTLVLSIFKVKLPSILTVFDFLFEENNIPETAYLSWNVPNGKHKMISPFLIGFLVLITIGICLKTKIVICYQTKYTTKSNLWYVLLLSVRTC